LQTAGSSLLMINVVVSWQYKLMMQ